MCTEYRIFNYFGLQENMLFTAIDANVNNKTNETQCLLQVEGFIHPLEANYRNMPDNFEKYLETQIRKTYAMIQIKSNSVTSDH